MEAGTVIWMVILTLSNAILIGAKAISKFINRKNNNPGGNTAKELAILKAKFEDLKEDNKEDHQRMQKNIDRIFTLLNGIMAKNKS